MEREICRIMHRTIDQNSFPGSTLPPVLITKRDIPNSRPKALIFDLMGTCCDWFSSIVPALESSPSHPNLPNSDIEQLAIDWREGFFKEIHYRFSIGEPAEDIDVTHRRVLDRLLEERGVDFMLWDDKVRNLLVDHWHSQIGWPDALPALSRLREKFFVVVLANGTTRLQLDIIKSTGLPFDMLFSSQLLGFTKPDIAIYNKTMDLLQLRPDDCVMVAAHAYDLRGAKQAGLGTVYIQRTTEDMEEDMAKVRLEVDLFLDGTQGAKSCGLGELAELLGA